MASSLNRAASKHSSARSLGSFVEVGSASSSDFDPVDLEEEEMNAQSRAEVDFSGRQSHSNPGSVLGKNATPPPVVAPALRSVPEQSEIKASPERSGEGASGAYEPLQEGLQNLENATHKAAELAKEFTNKLFTSGAADARSSVMRLAGDVSSWWAALDPVSKPSPESPEQTGRAGQSGREVQDLFGLPEEEELMERFACTLVQTMECSHNAFSKPQQVRSAGKLYVTDRHLCFNADGIRFAIAHQDVRKAEKLQGHSKALRIGFGDTRETVILEGFQATDLDSALGLLEHAAEA